MYRANLGSGRFFTESFSAVLKINDPIYDLKFNFLLLKADDISNKISDDLIVIK